MFHPSDTPTTHPSDACVACGYAEAYWTGSEYLCDTCVHPDARPPEQLTLPTLHQAALFGYYATHPVFAALSPEARHTVASLASKEATS